MLPSRDGREAGEIANYSRYGTFPLTPPLPRQGEGEFKPVGIFVF